MQKNNKLIAEFMGLEIRESKHRYITTYYVLIDDMPTDFQDLKYHESWDWLMPVVIKCFEVSEQTNDDLNFKLNDALLETNIDSLYKAVVEFIKDQKDRKDERKQ